MSDLAIDFDYQDDMSGKDYSPEEEANDLIRQKSPVKPVNTINFDFDDIPF